MGPVVSSSNQLSNQRMIDTNGTMHTKKNLFLPSHCTSVIFLTYLIALYLALLQNVHFFWIKAADTYLPTSCNKTRLEKLNSRKPGSLNEWVLLSCRSTKVVSLAITTPFLFFLGLKLLLLLAQFSGQVIFLRSTEKSSTLVALERGAAITFWKASFTGRTIDRDHPMSS